MYKVLEVREYQDTSKSSFSILYGGNSGYVDIEQTHITVVICENEENHERERFEFHKGYDSGDYDLLIAGDRFEIKKIKNTCKRVMIVKI